MSGSHPGVSGSFGELRGVFRDPVRPFCAKRGRSYMGGGPGLVWDLDGNYALRVFIGIFVKKKRPKLHGGVGAF